MICDELTAVAVKVGGIAVGGTGVEVDAGGGVWVGVELVVAQADTIIKNNITKDNLIIFILTSRVRF